VFSVVDKTSQMEQISSVRSPHTRPGCRVWHGRRLMRISLSPVLMISSSNSGILDGTRLIVFKHSHNISSAAVETTFYDVFTVLKFMHSRMSMV